MKGSCFPRSSYIFMAAAFVTLFASGPAYGTSTASHGLTDRVTAEKPSATSSVTSTPGVGASSADLTTYDYGNSRSGDDSYESAIRKVTSRPIWREKLDGAVYGEPLVYDGVIFVATENDTVYALSPKRGGVIWRLHVGTPVSTSVIDSAPTLSGGCGDIDPLGITGTPVIDPLTKQIFVAEETEVGGNGWQDIQHWLVGISLTTHRELWHRQIDPPDANQADHYYTAAEQQRAALTLLDGQIYVEFGGLFGDCGQYHGYVIDSSETGTGPLVFYQVPTGREGGIWGTAGAFVSPQGNLYIATGNGSSTSLAHFDEGNSVVELSPLLQRLGFWAPGNWVQLNIADWDLGSASPLAVPDTSLLFAAGKPAGNGDVGYLMNDSPLGGIGHGAFTGSVCPSGGAYGADATDVIQGATGIQIYVYVPCGSGTEALKVDPSVPISFHRVWGPSTGDPNGPPVVAGGLVWALDWTNGLLYAMNPQSGHVIFVRSTGQLNHFATPAVSGKLILVPTTAGVEAFGVA